MSVYTGFKYDKYILRIFQGTLGVSFMRVVQVTHQKDDGGGGGKGYQYSRGGGVSGCMMIYYQEWHISRQKFNFVTILYEGWGGDPIDYESTSIIYLVKRTLIVNSRELLFKEGHPRIT